MLYIEGDNRRSERTEQSVVRPTSFLEIGKMRITDNTGIPLESDRAEEEFTGAIDWMYQSCPYKDSPSRYPQGRPHTTPISGLERERLRTHYPEILSIVGAVREEYLRTTRKASGKSLDEPLDWIETKQLLLGLTYLPSFLAFRAEKPLQIHGELAPPIIILSNSSAGSLGALEGYIEHAWDEGRFGEASDVKKMVDMAEQEGTMVGEKTVCAASPEQMRHFISYVINGGNKYEGKFDIESCLNLSEEILPLLIFAENLRECLLREHELKGLDRLTSQAIDEAILSSTSPGRIVSLTADFERQSVAVLGELNQRNQLINQALGRSTDVELTLNDFVARGFKMPRILFPR